MPRQKEDWPPACCRWVADRLWREDSLKKNILLFVLFCVRHSFLQNYLQRLQSSPLHQLCFYKMDLKTTQFFLRNVKHFDVNIKELNLQKYVLLFFWKKNIYRYVPVSQNVFYVKRQSPLDCVAHVPLKTPCIGAEFSTAWPTLRIRNTHMSHGTICFLKQYQTLKTCCTLVTLDKVNLCSLHPVNQSKRENK